MDQSSLLDSLAENLERTALQLGGLPNVPMDTLQLRNAAEHLAATKERWISGVPSFVLLQNWVEVQWNPKRTLKLPSGLVRTDDSFGSDPERQLDAVVAGCKLLLAASIHGATTVASCAARFAAHGMVERTSLYLLQGAETKHRLTLDQHCTIIPYREALPAITSQALSLPDHTSVWPSEHTRQLCALEIKSFELQGATADDLQKYASSLVPDYDPRPLAYIIGLVWGKGVRACGGRHLVDQAFADTIPFFYIAAGTGWYVDPASASLFTLSERQSQSVKPLNVREIPELAKQHSALTGPTRKRVDLALRRLCDSAGRDSVDDSIVDVCIALEALFTDEHDRQRFKRRISARCSWYFADSATERQETRELLREFYDLRSRIVHGGAAQAPGHDLRLKYREKLENAENIVRACLKTMICEGRPDSWDDSAQPTTIRHEPRRSDSEIFAVKSDSMSWSLKEQLEIDHALESEWRPTIDDAPAAEPDANPIISRGVNRDMIEEFKKKGTYYILLLPVRLYMAHPKWTAEAREPIDERLQYYCERDIKRHFKHWREAATGKQISFFELPIEEPFNYSLSRFDWWRRFMAEAESPLRSAYT